MAFSLYLLFGYNSFQNTVYSQVASEVTGSINNEVNKVSYYFHLRKTNDSLAKENERLYNQLRADYNVPDTADGLKLDSIGTDSLSVYRRYKYLQAKVVRNSVSSKDNYIILHRGTEQGVKKDLGMIAQNGAVAGTVIGVSKNYSVVMSLLHSKSSISARLKKGGETGTLIWDGVDREVLLLKNISKSAKINEGDTVVTSGFSEKFPKGLILGYVKDIINDKSNPTFTVRVASAVNFETLQYGYVIDNLQKGEIDELMQKTIIK